MAKFKDFGGLVYSTDPDFRPDDDDNNDGEGKSLPPEKQKLVVGKSTKQRGGKVVTVVSGFSGTDEELDNLARMLKNKCGVGGGAKDGEILIQGDHRDKIFDLLQKEGYKKVKKSGI